MGAFANNMHSVWLRELGLLLLWVGLWTVAGFWWGYWLQTVVLGIASYLAMYLLYAYRLHRWLVDENRRRPEGFGVWQEIFLQFQRQKQRNAQSRQRLQSIVGEYQASTAALPDGAVVLDKNGRIVWFNQAAGSLLALRSPQDVGQRIANLVRHPRFSAYIAAGQFEEREIEVPSAIHDGMSISLRIIPYGDAQRLLIARDISAQKQLDATRRDFVANASHELRTPLTVLRGYLEMMTEETGGRAALARWQAPIKEMSAQALRMSRIIESLLKLARVEAEGYQQRQDVVDVPALIQRLLDDAEHTAGKTRQFSSEVDAKLSLYGRPGELESVFSNLIANAVQYTPEGGQITVRWWVDQTASYFSVTDTGIGIDPKYIPRLTERFYRVDPGRTSGSGGTGLGLAIVKHCLEHHEAELQVASEPNVGSCFTCRFPRQRAYLRHAA